MKNFVFFTDVYDEEAERHSATKILKEFRKKVSVEGYVHPKNMEYTKFPGNYLKIKHNNFRSVLTCKRFIIDDVDVCIYVALRMFPRGDADYDNFKLSNKSEESRDKITGKYSLNWDVYVEMAKKFLKEPKTVNDNPIMTPQETSFISSPLKINHDLFEVTIFETKEWINSVIEVDFTDFSNAANQIYSHIIDNLYSPEGWYTIEFKEQAILAYKRKDGNWILARLVDRKFNKDYSKEFPTSIPIDFQRGYPYTFLEDQDEWRLMEQDSKSNMVLSSQQVGIVSNFIKYPLFLTGRAGSGKSTLLQYLFAEIVLRYIKYRDDENCGLKIPVYLSYSSNLINDAKKLCRTLFEKNNVYKSELQKMNIHYKEDILPLLPKMFYVFRDLLCDCIEKKFPGTVRKKFSNDKYISFPKFNVMWKNKFGKVRNAARDYGPSISWHVIRTYIKGWDSETFITPDDYVQIGDKNQSVTVDTFKKIYDVVWDKWYSKLDGIWDDQDLVIFCLQNECVDDRFSAIFCDESQDFTRVEIDFILNSSSFAHRSINKVEDFNKLPFVFAGDEFQTLNPTGFSWESLRSYFTERLCSFVGIVPQKGMIPDPEILSENFRSTRNVVKLANRIQLLRASRFREFSSPQKSHFSQDGNSVYCILPSDKFALEKLKERGVILIVPANDGESIEEYISNSALNDVITFEDGVPKDITILNPTQAKGLEYPNVAIFGFNAGNDSGLSIDNLIKWFNNPESNLVKDIDLKYQISNAYVAVTRASLNLYIIDNVNRNSFWAFAFNQSEDADLEKDVNLLQSRMIESLSVSKRNLWSEDEIGWIEYVKDIDISDENLKFLKTEEHKNDLENRAAALHDVVLMRQAAVLHKSAGNKIDEARCRAKAAVYDGKYEDAAEWFIKAEMYDDAVNNYWLELNKAPKGSIVDNIKKLKSYSHNKKVDFCIATTAPSFRDAKIALNDIVDMLEKNLDEQGCIKSWEYIISLIIQNIQIKGKEGLRDLELILDYCLKLKAYDINVDISQLALKAYSMGAYKEAIDIWDKMDRAIITPEYCNAKLKIEKYPSTIEYYKGTCDPHWYNYILNEIRKNNGVELNDRQKIIVCEAIRISKAKDEFIKYLPFMLSHAEGIENTNQIMNEAVNIGLKLNVEVLRSIAELRFSNLQDWKRPKFTYVDSDTVFLFDAIEAVKRMRKDDFQSYLLRSLQGKKVNDFCGTYYKKFSRKKVSRIVYTELGKAFEQSGRFAYACIYYEWAALQSDESDFKKEMNKRWIVCKERHAEHEDNEDYRIAAMKKREEIGINDKELPLEPTISNECWEKIYSAFVKVGNEINLNKVNPNRIQLENVLQKETRSTSDENKSIDEELKTFKENHTIPILSQQEIRYADYIIKYFPEKKDIVIRDNNEYSVRIKHGIFPSNSDYELKKGRLYLVDENKMTPFLLNIQDNTVVIKVFEENIYTGMSFMFEL